MFGATAASSYSSQIAQGRMPQAQTGSSALRRSSCALRGLALSPARPTNLTFLSEHVPSFACEDLSKRVGQGFPLSAERVDTRPAEQVDMYADSHAVPMRPTAVPMRPTTHVGRVRDVCFFVFEPWCPQLAWARGKGNVVTDLCQSPSVQGTRLGAQPQPHRTMRTPRQPCGHRRGAACVGVAALLRVLRSERERERETPRTHRSSATGVGLPLIYG